MQFEQLQQLLQTRFCKRNASASFNTSLIKCLTTNVLPPSGSIVMMNYSNGLQLNASSDELAGLHIAMITRLENGSVEDTVVGGACISLIKRSKRSKPKMSSASSRKVHAPEYARSVRQRAVRRPRRAGGAPSGRTASQTLIKH